MRTKNITTMSKMTVEQLSVKIEQIIGWSNVQFDIQQLENGDIAVACLDVVDDWGEHISDGFEAIQDIRSELHGRRTSFEEDDKLLKLMELSENDSSWDLTWVFTII